MENIETQVVNKIIGLLNCFESENIDKVENALHYVLRDYDLKPHTNELANVNQDLKTKALQMFFISKKVEGLSDNSLKYYGFVLQRFFDMITVELDKITTNDIRFYVARRQIDKPDISKVTLNNERRVLNSFFSWCQAEDYILKNPMAAIKQIKTPKLVKKAFTELEMEKLRDACKDLRERAMIEVLYSTGVRCAELAGMKLTDINGDEVLVLGKGNKERIVYLNARALMSLQKLEEAKKFESDYLFCSQKSPYNKLSKGSIEKIIREIGQRAKVPNVHPHRFRRTAATLALNRGMPLEQVSQMLGHSSIETTTIYARSTTENVKESHKKFVV